MQSLLRFHPTALALALALSIPAWTAAATSTPPVPAPTPTPASTSIPECASEAGGPNPSHRPSYDPAGFIVVLDLTHDKNRKASESILSFALDGPETRQIDFKLAQAAEKTSNYGANTQGEIPYSEAARRCAVGHKDLTTKRFVSGKGGRVAVYVLYRSPDPEPEPEVSIEEEARDSQLAIDVTTLLRAIAAGELGASVDKKVIPLRVLRQDYVLEEKRANLKVVVKDSAAPTRAAGAPAPAPATAPAPSAPSDATAAKAAAAKEPPSLTTTMTTGPKEHWFLSVDVPVNKITELKFNDTTHILETQTKANRFLMGLDYFFGDLASPASAHLVLKLLLEASSRPANSLGVALAFRFKTLKNSTFELDAFSPFVGVLRHSEDQVSGSEVKKGAKNKYSFVAGLSFNLDKGLALLKGEKATEKKSKEKKQ